MIKEIFSITNYDTSTWGHSHLVSLSYHNSIKNSAKSERLLILPATFLSNSQLYLCLYAKVMQNKVSWWVCCGSNLNKIWAFLFWRNLMCILSNHTNRNLICILSNHTNRKETELVRITVKSVMIFFCSYF